MIFVFDLHWLNGGSVGPRLRHHQAGPGQGNSELPIQRGPRPTGWSPLKCSRAAYICFFIHQNVFVLANGVYSLILFCQHIAYSESELQCQGQRLEGKAVPIPDPGRRAFQEESKNQELRILTFAGGLPLS